MEIIIPMRMTAHSIDFFIFFISFNKRNPIKYKNMVTHKNQETPLKQIA